jgi:hypothetical protein
MTNKVDNLKLSSGANKSPVGIVPMHPLLGVARVLEDSAVKYAPFNYMAQPLADALSSYDSAELRHRIECTSLGGEVTLETYATPDGDSGIPHIYHRIADLLILASLMIRDGVISADPGMGQRKRNAHAVAPIRGPADAGYRSCVPRPIEVEASYHMSTTPGDPPTLDTLTMTADGLTDDDRARMAKVEADAAERAKMYKPALPQHGDR